MIALLKEVTAAVHEAIPNGLVLWYDSVTSTGALKWQNELNQLNKCYFDVCGTKIERGRKRRVFFFLAVSEETDV
jgi:endo-beta-N-acetylglucosaminidase D